MSTCCVTRAIHLELVLDLSTVMFIRTLKRFSGYHKESYQTNAKTFKAAARTIKMIFDHQDVRNYLSQVVVSIWRRPLVGWTVRKNGQINEEVSQESDRSS